MRLYLSMLVMSLLVWDLNLPAQTVPAGQQEDYVIPHDPRRDSWQKPDEVIKALNFSGSETVAVIENGYPYFAPRIAPLVKKVYAVNTDPRAFQGRGSLPPSVSPIVATSANPSLAKLDIDVIVMIDVLRLLPNRPAYFLALALALNPRGRVAIIDRIFPSVFPASEITTPAGIQGDLNLAGFGFVQSLNTLPYQYFIVLQR